MFASELPAGFDAGERMVSYTQVHRLFAASPAGKALSGKTRFMRFKPDGISESEWRTLLGAEADRLQHPLETWKTGKKFLFRLLESGQEMSDDDLVSLQLACLVHDWTGDEPDDLMTQALAADGATGEKLRALVPEVTDDRELRSRLDRAIERVFEDPSSGLLDRFLAIEGLGHADLMAWSWKKGSAIKGAYQEWFRYFALRLCVAVMPGLLKRRAYPGVAAWIETHRETLEAIIGLPEADIRYFPPDGFDRSGHPKGFIDRFDALRDAWSEAQAAS
jgi:hypothetical protein